MIIHEQDPLASKLEKSFMLCEEFINTYWSQYILLEKEFAATLHYLSLDMENEEAFSQAYVKLLLELGSEIDVAFKQYCTNIDPSFNGKNMTDYQKCALANASDFIVQDVEEKITHRNLHPWNEWTHIPRNAPYWWNAYNRIKHNRTEKSKINNVEKISYKFANQKYTLLALAGLYQILVYTYYKLAQDENKRIRTPMPGSRLFELKGGMWSAVQFWDEMAFYLDEESGEFWMESSILHYN